MKTPIAALLVTQVLLHAQAAEPAKPRFVPRPVPGMTKIVAKSPDQPAPRTAAAMGIAAASTPPPDKARILAIFRRGTLGLPKQAPAVPPAASPDIPKAAAAPGPGHVRILTKAEADVIAAQPSP